MLNIMSDFRFRVEETSNLKDAGKPDKKNGPKIRRGSGPTPVARGGCGAKDPPLAARSKQGPSCPRDLLQNSAFLLFRYFPRFLSQV